MLSKEEKGNVQSESCECPLMAENWLPQVIAGRICLTGIVHLHLCLPVDDIKRRWSGSWDICEENGTQVIKCWSRFFCEIICRHETYGSWLRVKHISIFDVCALVWSVEKYHIEDWDLLKKIRNFASKLSWIQDWKTQISCFPPCWNYPARFLICYQDTAWTNSSKWISLLFPPSHTQSIDSGFSRELWTILKPMVNIFQN